MSLSDELRQFYSGKRVFVTGHTGFKGSWLCMMLKQLGADVYGYSLAPDTDPAVADSYNIGPNREDCINTGAVADTFVKYWGESASWKNMSEADAPHEAAFLMLDNTKVGEVIGWVPKWHTDTAIEKTVAWYKTWNNGEDVRKLTNSQIMEYMGMW